MVWLQVSGAIAQPSVYSGAFEVGEDTSSPTNWVALGAFETNAGKPVSIVNFYNSWSNYGPNTNGTAVFQTNAMNNFRSHGCIPMFTWQPENSADPATNQIFNLTNIINGYFDGYIVNWALSAKAWGHPFFLRFAHEMNGNWYPWSESINGNASGEYARMWRHVHDLFTLAGATNVTWVWCVNVVEPGYTPIAELYPGDNYVDWIALDGYNWPPGWQDFSNLAAQTITELTNIAPGKPIMVGETGCYETNKYSKGQWFLNALTNYLPATPRIKAWVYFDSTNSYDWLITSSPNALTNYQNAIALSFYASNQYGAITSSPIQPLLSAMTTTPPFVSIVCPAMDCVTTNTVVTFGASASSASGISNVVFAVNGAPQATNNFAPYQYFWPAPASLGLTNTVTATAYDNAGNSAASTIQVVTTSAVSITGIQVSSNRALVSWPAAAANYGYALQESTNLTAPDWMTVTNAPGVVNGQYQVSLPAGYGNAFYRLAGH